MPELVLTYLDFPGRAQVIRKALTVASIPFTDQRVSREELVKLKPSLPYKKVPILSVDGDVVAEAQAVFRLAGKIGGLYPPPSDPLACLIVDEILDSWDDLRERIIIPLFVETDAEKRKQLQLAMLNGPLPLALESLNQRLSRANEYAFFKANADSVFLHHIASHDWTFFFRLGMVEHIPTSFIDKYKAIVTAFDLVESKPNVNQQRQHQASIRSLPRLTQLKLTYFDSPGRAESIRLALRIAGVEFSDERISYGEFLQRRNDFPNRQVPVLTVDGQAYAQSLSLLRYVGSLTGFYPINDPIEAAKIDEICSHIGELHNAIDPSQVENDQEKKRKMREDLLASTIPESLDTLNRRIAYFKQQKKSDHPFAMGGDQPTVADFAVSALVLYFSNGHVEHIPTTVVDSYVQIIESSKAVMNHPRVKDWYA